MSLLDASTEHRKVRRFDLCAPAFFCWTGPDGNLQTDQGATQDISARGVFVLCTSGPPVGGHIELDVYLPALSGAPRSVQLHGEGKVLRVDREDGRRWGFAAEVAFQAESSNGMTVLNSKIQ